MVVSSVEELYLQQGDPVYNIPNTPGHTYVVCGNKCDYLVENCAVLDESVEASTCVYTPQGIYHVNEDTIQDSVIVGAYGIDSYVQKKAVGVKRQKERQDLMVLETEDGCIICSDKHVFLTKTGVYKYAKDLTVDDELQDIDYYGYVYLTENLINGKIYVGRHKSKTYDPNYIGSGNAITAAIKKYGKQNFKNYVIRFCLTEEELADAEAFYIRKMWELVGKENTYNLIDTHTGQFYKNIQLNRVYLNKDGVTRCFTEAEVQSLLEQGWTRGFAKGTKGTICITNGIENKYIYKEEYESKKDTIYKDWTLGSAQKGNISIHKGNINTKVLPAQLQQYLDDGWVLGLSDKVKDIFKHAQLERYKKEEERTKHAKLVESRNNSNIKFVFEIDNNILWGTGEVYKYITQQLKKTVSLSRIRHLGDMLVTGVPRSTEWGTITKWSAQDYEDKKHI